MHNPMAVCGDDGGEYRTYIFDYSRDGKAGSGEIMATSLEDAASMLLSYAGLMSRVGASPMHITSVYPAPCDVGVMRLP